MGNENEYKNDVGKLEGTIGIGVHYGGEVDQQNGARQELGSDKHDELQLTQGEECAQQGYGDEDGQRVAIGTDSLHESVHLGAATPLAKGPENNGGHNQIGERERGRRLDAAEFKLKMVR